MNEKLTAYALNELPPEERAELEAQMKDDPELRKEAEEMKDFCAMLGDELHADAEDETLKPEQRSKLVQSFQSTERKVIYPAWRRSAILSSLGLAAAACVALFFALHGLDNAKSARSTADDGDFVYALNKHKAQPATKEIPSQERDDMLPIPLREPELASAQPIKKMVLPAPEPVSASPVAPDAAKVPHSNLARKKMKLPSDQSGLSVAKDARAENPKSPGDSYVAAPAEFYTYTDPLKPNNGGNPSVTLSNGSLTYSSVGKDSLPGVSVDGMILASTNPTSGGSHVRGSTEVAFPNRAKTAEPPLLTGSGGVLSPNDPSPTVAFNQMQAVNSGGDHFEARTSGTSAPTVVKSGAGVTNVTESLQYAGTVAPPAPPTQTFRVESPESKLIGGWTAPVEDKVPLIADLPITGGLFAPSSPAGKSDSTSPLLAANSGNLGGGGLTSAGFGTFTLSGGISYTGGSSVNGGTLTFDGSASPSTPSQVTGSLGILTAGGTTSTASSSGTNTNSVLVATNSGATTTVTPGIISSTAPAPTGGHFKSVAGKAESPKSLADAGHTEKTPPEIMNPTARDAPVAREKGKIADAKKSQSQLSEITKAEKTAPALPGAASAGVAAGPAAPVPASAASGAPVATPLPLAEPEVKPANTLPPVVAIQQKVVADDEGAIHPQPTAGATRAPSDPEFDHHKELTDKISDLKKEADAIPDNTPERVAKDKELKGKYRELREYESRMNLRRQRADEERRLAEETERLRRLEEQREAEERARREGPTTATYRPITENPFTFVQRQPFSTFSIDVDTASYANVRRFLDAHQRPPADAVRLEEMINYFPYSYSPPKDDRPFSVKVDMADAPWQPLHRIARVAIKGREIKADERPAANFTFLLDVSGSMSPPERLPLVKQALRLLVEQLREDDRVSIVTYAGESGLAMESTGGDHKEEILQAIEALHAGGSTNGAGGIRLAYTQAVRHFKKNGINRVILCTDGDFNVGMSSVQELEMLIAEKAKTGVFLSVLGVGTDNLHDHTMQTLADRGNGNYHYLDSLSEARKVLVDQLTGTLVTIAKDVKIQIEFNPAQVAAYRLIGYEKRMLATQDFNNDKKDAGEIGAGHTITALYEIVPAKMKYPDGQPVVDDRRYGKTEVTASSAAAEEKAKPESSAHTNESMTVKLRYKEPNEDKSKLIAVPVTDSLKTMGQNDHDFQFAAAVAGFGMLLRDSPYGSDLTWDSVRELARAGKGSDPQGWRGEFIQLIDRARGIYGDPR